jgi:hypothetical protein
MMWLAILAPRISYPFLSDDYGFLAAYRSVSDITRPFEFYRPAFASVFLLLARLGGGSPIPFHAAAFALHLASAWLVYRLARRLSSGPPLVAAAVFLLNPVQLEAVLWTSGLQELLWTFFLLAALVVWIGEERVSARRVGWTAVLVALALWSKETAICVVLLLPIIELAAFGTRRVRAAALAWGVVGAECACYLVLRRRAVTIDNTFFVRPSHYFFKQMLVTPYEVFIHPWNRTAINVPMSLLCAAALVALALVCAVLWRSASARSLAGPAIIAATVLPAYSMFYVAADLAGARYLYFGAAGFGILTAELLSWMPGMLRVTAMTALAVAFGWSLSLNLRPWRATETLIEAMQSAIVAGEDPGSAIKTWQASHARGLVLRDGIPDSYQGVWVFRNGYHEFLARESDKAGE